MHAIIEIPYMQGIDPIFYVLVLIMSVVAHEVAHGYVADAQGDPTARHAGRLTLNPLKHIDPIGSVILPLLLTLMSAGFVVGWARPVPYIESNLRNKRWGSLFVTASGILVNIGIAVIFGFALRYAHFLGSAQYSFMAIAAVIVKVNILLALFNLIPVPPLDGYKILFGLLPPGPRTADLRAKVEYVALPLLLVFVLFVWPYVLPLMGTLFTLITGMPMSMY
mgnify:CR=1 FL=1